MDQLGSAAALSSAIMLALPILGKLLEMYQQHRQHQRASGSDYVADLERALALSRRELEDCRQQLDGKDDYRMRYFQLLEVHSRCAVQLGKS